MQFNPHLAPMRRGIATTITVPAATGATIEGALRGVARRLRGPAVCSLFCRRARRPTRRTSPARTAIDISAVHDARTGNFVITSALDNLVKGASGQAVQIMNLWCGFPETAGLL